MAKLTKAQLDKKAEEEYEQERNRMVALRRQAHEQRALEGNPNRTLASIYGLDKEEQTT